MTPNHHAPMTPLDTAQQKFTAERLSLSRHHKDVLCDVSLALAAGEMISLLGANGAGKSSFLSVLAGELTTTRPSRTHHVNSSHDHCTHTDGSNKIMLNAQSLAGMSGMQQARARSVVPQKSELAFDLDVREVVAMGAYPYPELDKTDVQDLCVQAMTHADITDLAQRMYPELSGGEQQRVHYARAVLQVLCGFYLTHDTRYILLDEPTSSLDPLHQHALLRSVRVLARDHALGVLVILHDVNLAALFSDRIALLSDGHVLACDTPSRVLTTDNLRNVYRVDAHVMEHPLHPNKPLVVFG